MKIYNIKDTVNFDNITLGEPGRLHGGAYYCKLYLDRDDFLFSTPQINTKNGIVQTGKKKYIDLMFDGENELFTMFLLNFEEKIKSIILEKAPMWFDNDIEKDDIDYLFNSCIRSYKAKFNLVRTHIHMKNINTFNVFDENEVLKTHNDVVGKKIISLLHFKGIKFTSTTFQIDIENKQIMILDDKPAFQKCMLSRKKQEDEHASQENNDFKFISQQDNNNNETEINTNDDITPADNNETDINNIVNDLVEKSINNAENNIVESTIEIETEPENGEKESSIIYLGETDNDASIVLEEDVTDDNVETKELSQTNEVNQETTKNDIIEETQESQTQVTQDTIETKYTSDISQNLELTENTLDSSANNAVNEENEQQQMIDDEIQNDEDAEIMLNIDNDSIVKDLGIIEDLTNIETENESNTLVLKKPKEIYYSRYRDAVVKALQAKRAAILSYMEALNIKETYLEGDLEENENIYDEDLEFLAQREF